MLEDENMLDFSRMMVTRPYMPLRILPVGFGTSISMCMSLVAGSSDSAMRDTLARGIFSSGSGVDLDDRRIARIAVRHVTIGNLDDHAHQVRALHGKER